MFKKLFQEILEEQLGRLLTRDYLDLVMSLMRGRGKSEGHHEDGEETMADVEISNNQNHATSTNTEPEPLSKLGQMVSACMTPPSHP